VSSRPASPAASDVTADDAFGHHRVSSTTYDPEGIFPSTSTNAAGHTTLTEFDAGLGVLTKLTDLNLLVTQWSQGERGAPAGNGSLPPRC
jgi:hypothetical protein